jgi:hypothetical protein
VTGVQTCALPIFRNPMVIMAFGLLALFYGAPSFAFSRACVSCVCFV